MYVLAREQAYHKKKVYQLNLVLKSLVRRPGAITKVLQHLAPESEVGFVLLLLHAARIQHGVFAALLDHVGSCVNGNVKRLCRMESMSGEFVQFLEARLCRASFLDEA